MPPWELKEGQLAKPVLWISEPRALPQIPDTSDEIMVKVFDAQATRRIKTWGHDAQGVHWLSTRSGTAMHTDSAFARYTHHLSIRNDGFYIHGLDESANAQVIVPGTLLCLDTWSPHKVSRDLRINPHLGPKVDGLYKVQLVVDRPQPLTIEEAWELLSPRLSDVNCLVGLDKAGGLKTAEGRARGY